MDPCVWLLQNGVPPSRARWIMPRDAWLLNRANFQPGAENFEASMGAVISQFEIIAEASSLPDLFHRLEAADLLLRIDPQVEPACYRCAVVSRGELRTLRAHSGHCPARQSSSGRAVEACSGLRRSPRRSGHALRRLLGLRYTNASGGPRLRRRYDQPSHASDVPTAFQRSAHRMGRSPCRGPCGKECAL